MSLFPFMRSGRRALAAGLLAVGLAWLVPAPGVLAAPPAQATEPQIKAAFLFQFGAYVDWPAEAFERPDSPIGIAVLGSDKIADMLAQSAARRTLNGRPVVVHKLTRGDLPAGLQVLFVARASRGQLDGIRATLRHRPVLVVTEDAQSFDEGSMINFVVDEGKVRFDVALLPVEKAGLKISARLLGVARKVTGRAAS